MNSSLYVRSTVEFYLLHFTRQSAQLRRIRPSSSSRCLCRPFSQTAGRVRSGAMSQAMKQKSPPQLSIKNRVSEAQAKMDPDEIPDDIGLLPGTFVRPIMSRMPSLWRDPKNRMRMEWNSWKFRALNFASVFFYCKYEMKPRKLPLELRGRSRKALELHKEMYTAFADGDKATLKKICCTGLSDNFEQRISRRPHSCPKLIWTLHKYVRFPFSPSFSGGRVIADRAAKVPGVKDMGIRQVVVRIRSKQSLVKPAAIKKSSPSQRRQKSTPVQQEGGTDKSEQDCTEYVVIQRMILGGVQGDWKVWGTAEETTVEKMLNDPAFAPGLSTYDRVSLMNMEKK